MFKVQASSLQLKNLIIQEVSDRVYCLFPRDKGWKLLLPQIVNKKTASIRRHTLVLNQDREFLCFLVSNQQVKPSFFLPFLKNIQQEHPDLEPVFLTDEQTAPDVLEFVSKQAPDLPILQLGSEGLSFIKGEFSNERLNFRIQKTPLNTELITGNLIYYPFDFADTQEKGAFLRKVFTALTSEACRRQPETFLKQLLWKVYPCRDFLSQSEQEQIFTQVSPWLLSVFSEYLAAFMEIKESGKKTNTDYLIQFSLPDTLNKQKWIKMFTLEQEKALKAVSRESRQLDIDEEINSIITDPNIEL